MEWQRGFEHRSITKNMGGMGLRSCCGIVSSGTCEPSEQNLMHLGHEIQADRHEHDQRGAPEIRQNPWLCEGDGNAGIGFNFHYGHQ